jgi:hypothetical protein
LASFLFTARHLRILFREEIAFSQRFASSTPDPCNFLARPLPEKVLEAGSKQPAPDGREEAAALNVPARREHAELRETRKEVIREWP